MSQKTRQINPECGRRLKQLLNKNGMTQQELADRLAYNKQHISNVICGKRSLTLDMAKRIKIEVFPEAFLDWLLGMSDYETDAEASKKEWEETQKAEIFYDKIFRCFIDGIEDLCGYGLHSQGADLLIGDYIAVSDTNGKKVGVITAESFERLRHEIENFASYSLNLLIKTEMAPFPNSITGGGSNG